MDVEESVGAFGADNDNDDEDDDVVRRVEKVTECPVLLFVAFFGASVDKSSLEGGLYCYEREIGGPWRGEERRGEERERERESS